MRTSEKAAYDNFIELTTATKYLISDRRISAKLSVLKE